MSLLNQLDFPVEVIWNGVHAGANLDLLGAQDCRHEQRPAVKVQQYYEPGIIGRRWRGHAVVVMRLMLDGRARSTWDISLETKIPHPSAQAACYYLTGKGRLVGELTVGNMKCYRVAA